MISRQSTGSEHSLRWRLTATVLLAALHIGFTAISAFSGDTVPRLFRKVQISKEYFAEGAAYGDFNRDGTQDIACGPYWYEGPEYKRRHPIYNGKAFPNDQGYSDTFFSFGHDINGDGWTDVVRIGFPGKPAHWFENPRGADGDWPKHLALQSVGTESPIFADLTGDGRPEIVCAASGKLGYGEFDPANPAAEWTFHAITDPGPWSPFTHGLGVGDVNGDGRADVLTALGWLEQPASREDDPLWEPHLYNFCPGGAQMYVDDVDGDGDNDVITSLRAHAYGLSWFENLKGDGGNITFKPHQIMGTNPGDNPFGVCFSQLHAVALHDMDGDGLKDIITGKCFWAHNGKDPGAHDPAVLYYFKLVRGDNGAEYVPVEIDADSGVGRQVSIGDLNGDGRPDIVVANKKGVFAFQQQDKEEGNKLSGWPMVESVESQPLLVQIDRLRDALDFLGSPLSADTQQSLEGLKESLSDAEIAQRIQQLLDEHCLAAVQIDPSGGAADFTVISGPAPRTLYEQGWRTFLVKVVNRAEVAAALEITSPNAQSLPNSPRDQVAARWLDLSMYTGRPLKPLLSGLSLEYRLLQLYSSKAGVREATLRFRLGDTAVANEERPTIVRQWTFENGMDGWEVIRDCDAHARHGFLHIDATGNDSSLMTKIDVDNGPLEVRVWLKSDKAAFTQVFWQTDEEPTWHFSRAASLFSQVGGGQEYSLVLPEKGRVTALRFDPMHRAGHAEVDWIRLSRVGKGKRNWTDMAATFETQPSYPVTFNVLDDEGRPCVAAFIIRDHLKRIYPTPSKRLAPDFFFQPQIYLGSAETVSLPAGEYTVECRRGPESLPVTKKLNVFHEPTEFVYRVNRWIDPARLGWWSGDHHIHAAGCLHYASPTEGVHARDMARHIQGEDLKVGCNLTWGPCFDYQKQFFTGKVDKASEYPYLLRYDIEVSGFGSHVSGHLCLLRLQEQIYPGGASTDHWPTLGLNTLKWAKAQGAVCGPAHSSAGLSPSQERVEGADGPPLHGWTAHQVGLPNYFIPRYDGIGANEFIVDITHDVPGPDGQLVPAVDFISTMDTDRAQELNMWYHTLNCGFRVRASGETDFPCISGDRVGMGRVYVKVDDKLGYDKWCEGIRQGRSYVSDGSAHLIDFRADSADAPQKRVELGQNGSELHLSSFGTVRLHVKAAVLWENAADVPVEVIVNGYPVKKQQVKADGNLRELSFEVPVERSSWVAIRAAHSAHTNPIFVLVNEKPIRASVASAEWCLKGVDQCWKSKQPTYAENEQEAAKAAYDRAREVYRARLQEARAATNRG